MESARVKERPSARQALRVKATNTSGGRSLSRVLYHDQASRSRIFPQLAQPHSTDLVFLLAKARRLYEAALQAGDLVGAVKHKKVYGALFERRRRILLAQGEALTGGVR